MARFFETPFALPRTVRSGRPPLLGGTHFLLLFVGIAVLPLAIVGAIGLLNHQVTLDAADRLEVQAYRQSFGFTVGDVPRAGARYLYFGVTQVTPGSRADGAGLRVHDVVAGSASALTHAVREATAGRRACVEVWNVADEQARPERKPPTRKVCFDP